MIVRAAATAVLLAVTAACGGEETSEDLQARVDALVPRMEALSGLEARGPVRVERRSREELRAYVERQLADELPAEEVAGIGAAYKALGLLPDTLDLRRLLLDLYTEQVLGYYDPATDRLYVIAGVPAASLEPVLAHELVHALQDQHVDLDSLIDRERGNDRVTAAQAAIEGQATLAMFAWLAERETGRTVDPGALPDLLPRLRPALEAQNEQYPVFRSAPRIIRETLLFPYLGGARFVQELWRRRGQTPPLDEQLPQSTEQVLHPRSRFIEDRDPPTDIVLEPAAEGGAAVYESTLGELETSILLEEHLGAGAGSAAEGWDGDRYRVIVPAGGDAPVLVAYSVWDDADAADRYADAYRRMLDRRPTRIGRVERLEVAGRPVVRVVDAPAGSDLDGVPVPAVEGLEESRGAMQNQGAG